MTGIIVKNISNDYTVNCDGTYYTCKPRGKFRINSHPGEIKEKNYLRINNTKISAEEVAKMIKEKFEL